MSADNLTLCAGALLLDNDGVLVQSSESIRRSFWRWGKLYGVDGDQIYRELAGRRSLDIATIALGPSVAAEAAAALDDLEQEDAASVRAMPGVADFLRGLSGEWTLVTSAGRHLAEARLRAAGLPAPKEMVTAELLDHGKPDPECYLLAAKMNQFPPEQCVVFEDSSHGIAAAVAAGCQTVQIGGHARASGAVASIPSFQYARAKRGASSIEIQLIDPSSVKTRGGNG